MLQYRVAFFVALMTLAFVKPDSSAQVARILGLPGVVH
jgi:hypothetical protein